MSRSPSALREASASSSGRRCWRFPRNRQTPGQDWLVFSPLCCHHATVSLAGQLAVTSEGRRATESTLVPSPSPGGRWRAALRRVRTCVAGARERPVLAGPAPSVKVSPSPPGRRGQGMRTNRVALLSVTPPERPCPRWHDGDLRRGLPAETNRPWAARARRRPGLRRRAPFHGARRFVGRCRFRRGARCELFGLSSSSSRRFSSMAWAERAALVRDVFQSLLLQSGASGRRSSRGS